VIWPAQKFLILGSRDCEGTGVISPIGSTTVRENDPENDLLLVISQRSDGGWSIALTSYQLTKEVVDCFVDPLDLDYDGSDEIITILSDYESWDYVSYKKKGAEWRKIFAGGGRDC
jgi:hypothetical protein